MNVTTVTGKTRAATDAERANFIEMSLDTETALSTAIARLRTQQDLFADAQESRRLRVQIGLLEAELAKVHAEALASVAEERQIAPPNADEVTAMKELVTKLDGLVAGQKQTDVILKAATDAANAWAGRKPAGA
jgi:hypothetical protein